MKAIRLIRPGCALELCDLPVPAPGPLEVLVRVRAAGICHSDAHYRAGKSRVEPLPLTLGHEVAGVVEQPGREVNHLKPGDRVCLHYLATCGECGYCRRDNEQFCPSGQMIGKFRDGGFAEYIVMPARSVFKLPEEIPFAHGAIMMCSSATSLHALYQARLRAGDTVAVFGVGGLGVSAIQLARAMGAGTVFAVDINPRKLELAAGFGAISVNVNQGDPVATIQELTQGRGVDVALELIGLPLTMQQAVRSLAIHGRAALVGITDKDFPVSPYHEIINKEAEIIGVSDHLAREIPLLIESVRAGKLNLSGVISRAVPLEAQAINDTLDQLEGFGDDVRVVVKP
ncbi:MAG: alcohol dehydrogenase catalytic domain-containing protein [Verrucomicrobiae bacterium]|nr:alcohol dehydrogenase catalytic domain-containing protein [Verrucomicrobiae bacterium]